MSGSKQFDKIAWTVTALILVLTMLFMNGSALGLAPAARTMGYEARLFDNTRVHTIDIVMDDWDGFIKNATSEEYYTAALVIDGEAYKNVGIRGKGNTSLSTVASMNSSRYSFKVEFDHYDDSITYHGLDKLSLNNLIQDDTMMKDYLTYTMMQKFGAAAPLCSFVYITVNGEDWGLYLAVEGVEDSFLKRNYGSSYGELYKPDSMNFGGGRGNGKDFNMDDFMNREAFGEDAAQETPMPQQGGFDPFAGGMPDMGNFDPSQMPDMGGFDPFAGGMPDMGNFDPTQMPDMGGFDPAQLPGGFPGGMPSDPEQPDAQQAEQESGGKPSGGKGGFGRGASDVKLQYVDENIDSYTNIWNNAKTDITKADQTRLIASLKDLTNGENISSVVDVEEVIRYFVVHNYVCNGDSYTGAMIHNYYLYEENGMLAMLPWDYNLAYGTFQGGSAQSTVNTPIDTPVSGGTGEDRPMWSWIVSDERYTELYHRYFSEFLSTVDVQTLIDTAYEQIKPYVAKDPTAFCTYEEFETGVAALRAFCELRSESIAQQLANNETVSNMNYVDASALTLSDMGSMGGGFGGGKPGGEEMPAMGEKPNGFAPENMPAMGEMPADFGGNFPGQQAGGEAPITLDTAGKGEAGQNTGRPQRGEMQMPGGMPQLNGNGMNNTALGGRTGLLLLVSAAVLAVGLLVAKWFKD